jgi:hypothetical protein
MLEEAFWNLVWISSFLSLDLISFFSYTTIFYSHIESYTPAVKLNTCENSLLLRTCRKLLSCVYSLQSSKGPYILALQLYTSVLHYHAVDQAHVLFLHTCIVYCLVQNYVSCTSIASFHVLGENLGSFLYLNLNIFASKYSPTYDSEVSKTPQSVAPTKDCNCANFITQKTV